MKNKKLVIAVVAVVVVIGVLAGVYFATRPDPNEGMKEITVTVVHADGTAKEFTHATEQEYLGSILDALSRAESEKDCFHLAEFPKLRNANRISSNSCRACVLLRCLLQDLQAVQM